MTSEDTGGPAFPTTKPLDHWGDPNAGMSLRDWFAGQALGAASGHAFANAAVMGHLPEEWAARIAYALADAMLAERSK